METKIVWFNEAYQEYDKEQDSYYLVRSTEDPHQDLPHRIKRPHLPRQEWFIVGAFYTREEAIERAEEFSQQYPGAPIKIERESWA